MGRETGHDAMEKLQMYGSVFRPVSVRVGGLFFMPAHPIASMPTAVR